MRTSAVSKLNLLRGMIVCVLLALAAGCGSNNCDPRQILEQYYNSADSRQFDKSLSFFADDAELTTWAEGVNGRHWHERHYRGPEEIRSALDSPGLRRISANPDLPKYVEKQATVRSNRVALVLQADRLRPNGRVYNPYQVDVTFENCKIKTMTVVERISWE